MNLKKKKQLAARTLGVGIARISFRNDRIDEIKEAITKQDIRDLVSGNAIIVNGIKGRKSHVKRKSRGMGRTKKKIRNRKQTYVKLTRKLRNYLKEIKKQNRLTKEEYRRIRKQIKSKMFRSKSHMKELIGK